MSGGEPRARLLGQAERVLLAGATDGPAPARVFLPLYTHRLALRREMLFVLGGRGAGKSAFFRLLGELGNSARVGAFFGTEVPEATWLDAFSDSAPHPPAAELESFAGRAQDVALRAFWMSHLVRRVAGLRPDLVGELPPGLAEGWSLDAAETHIAAAAARLDALEQTLAGRGELLFACYDHLDHLAPLTPEVRRRWLQTLLALWLSLSNRYRHLRAKIFLRDDLFDAVHTAFAADTGTLRSRAVRIEWDAPALYRLLVRRLAQGGEELRAWLAQVPGLDLCAWDSDFGFLPPEMEEPLQRAFAEHLAGTLMGTGIHKVSTYRWLPNRLPDGRGQSAPRSLLNLVGYACAAARRDPLRQGPRLLTPDDLRAALPFVSDARIAEVAEEYPPVARLGHLRGEELPLDRKRVVERLGTPVPAETAAGPSGEAVFDELVRLGVLIVRDDRYDRGRIDVPDLYRYGFGLLRKGGVKRPA